MVSAMTYFQRFAAAMAATDEPIDDASRPMSHKVADVLAWTVGLGTAGLFWLMSSAVAVADIIHHFSR